MPRNIPLKHNQDLRRRSVVYADGAPDAHTPPSSASSSKVHRLFDEETVAKRYGGNDRDPVL